MRELENTIERAMTLADGPVLDAASFRDLVGAAPSAARSAADEQFEAGYILEVLNVTRWNRREASRILGISTVTLWRRVGSRSGGGGEEGAPVRS